MSSQTGIGTSPPRFTRQAARRPAQAGLVYAEFPTRAAAFVVDLVLAAAVVIVAAAILGYWAYPFGTWPQFEATVPIEMLGLAIAATLPTAAAAWLWRGNRRATPGQRLFRLQTVHWLTGGRLSLRAAFARWVLLFAPMTLLVAYPQVVATAADTGPFPILIELPWLPFATMTLPLLWYLALGASALSDQRRLRGLHDRVCGSVVVRDTRPVAPRRAGDLHGEQALSELAPFSWFARLGLPALFWLAALIVAADRALYVLSFRGEPAELAPVALHALVATLTMLLPVALLWRVRDAAQRYPLLLAGLGLAALLVLVPALAGLVSRGGPNVAAIVQGAPLGWLAALAPLLIGLGLLAMRAQGPTRPVLLLAIASLLLVAGLAPVTMNQGASVAVVGIASVGVFALMSAVPAWITISAWLDGDGRRAFWGLLALGSGAALVPALAGLAVIVWGDGQLPDLQPVISLIAWLGAAIGALLALVAYGWLAPRT